MFLYNLTLQRATGISYAIHGNFSGKLHSDRKAACIDGFSNVVRVAKEFQSVGTTAEKALGLLVSLFKIFLPNGQILPCWAMPNNVASGSLLVTKAVTLEEASVVGLTQQ